MTPVKACVFSFLRLVDANHKTLGQRLRELHGRAGVKGDVAWAWLEQKAKQLTPLMTAGSHHEMLLTDSIDSIGGIKTDVFWTISICPAIRHLVSQDQGNGMGIVWEAYHKGVPLLGVPENPTVRMFSKLFFHHGTRSLGIDELFH